METIVWGLFIHIYGTRKVKEIFVNKTVEMILRKISN